MVVVVLVLALVVLVLAELVLDYLFSVMFVVLGDPPVVLIAFVLVLALVVLTSVAVMVVVVLVLAFVVVVAFVLVLALVLVGVTVIVFVLVLAFVLVKDADLLLIPTVARRRGHPGGRACSASSSRGASARSPPARPKGVPVS